MKSNNVYTENGNYNHPQFEGGITLKQYIFAKQNHKSCLLFRFRNESPDNITSFEFLLTELGTDGRVISRRKIVESKLNIIPGEMFSPQESFVVSDGCADFRIKLLSYVSGAYKYSIRHGRAVPQFDPRGYDAPNTGTDSGIRPIITKKFSEDAKIFKIIAFCAIALIVTAYLLI